MTTDQSMKQKATEITIIIIIIIIIAVLVHPIKMGLPKSIPIKCNIKN